MSARAAGRAPLLAASLALVAAAAIGCGSETGGSGGTGGTGGTGGSGTAGSGTGASSTGGSGAGGSGTGASSTGGSSSGGSGAGGSTGGSSSGGSSGVSVDALLALTANCDVASNGDYATDEGENETISICKLNGAFFWKADMDIDCDGKITAACNSDTDPAFYNGTSASDSNGDPLDAAALPFFVIPLPSSRFDYDAQDIHLGATGAVLYQGKLQFGIFADEGPSGIIGEASYAMASLLGVDPDPSFGGTDSGVTYFVFTGTESVVGTNEDHAEAVTLGAARAQAVLDAN